MHTGFLRVAQITESFEDLVQLVGFESRLVERDDKRANHRDFLFLRKHRLQVLPGLIDNSDDTCNLFLHRSNWWWRLGWSCEKLPRINVQPTIVAARRDAYQTSSRQCSQIRWARMLSDAHRHAYKHYDPQEFSLLKNGLQLVEEQPSAISSETIPPLLTNESRTIRAGAKSVAANVFDTSAFIPRTF